PCAVGAPGSNAIVIGPEEAVPESTPVHWPAEGQAKALALLRRIAVASGVPGELGSNVIAWPSASMAVQRPSVGHAARTSGAFRSTATGAAAAGEAGSNVTSWP